MQTKNEREKYIIDINNATKLTKQIQPLLCEKKLPIALQNCFEVTDLLIDKRMNIFYPMKARKLLLEVISWFESFLSSKVLDLDNQNKCCAAMAKIYYFWASWEGFGYYPPDAMKHYQTAIKYKEQFDPKKTEDYLQLGFMYNSLSRLTKEKGDVGAAFQLAAKAISYLGKIIPQESASS